jgi:hypothetical protein
VHFCPVREDTGLLVSHECEPLPHVLAPQTNKNEDRYHRRHLYPPNVFPDNMKAAHYECECGRELDYQTTKHNGCPDCGRVPLHSAD